MGEYAEFQGQRVKIGTCEDMYYLRADQRHMVKPLPGYVDPVADKDDIRFRFPFPDEDHLLPGMFSDHDRSIRVWGASAPTAEKMDHYSVRFKADNGYLVSLRSQADEENRTAERNGTPGNADIAAQLHTIADRVTAGYVREKVA